MYLPVFYRVIHEKGNKKSLFFFFLTPQDLLVSPVELGGALSTGAA